MCCRYLHNQKNKRNNMAEEKIRLKVWSIQKDCLSLQSSQVYPDFFGIQKTKQCASFSHNGNLRSSRNENGECCAVVFAPSGADFCHIPFSRFLRTSVRRIWAESALYN